MQRSPHHRRGVSILAAVVVFAVLATVILWPDGLSGWRFIAFVAGVLVSVLAALRSDATRQPLWLVSGFLAGGAMIMTVFHSPFDTRRCLGLVLLAALLAFLIIQPDKPGAKSRMKPYRQRRTGFSTHD